MMMEMPSARFSIVSKIRSMQQSKVILTTVVRFNGMNCPEMTENLCKMEKSGVTNSQNDTANGPFSRSCANDPLSK